MYHAKTPVTVPTDPDRVYWDYTQGKQLRDLTCRELAGYYSRLIRWYTQAASPMNLVSATNPAITIRFPTGGLQRDRRGASADSGAVHGKL